MKDNVAIFHIEKIDEIIHRILGLNNYDHVEINATQTEEFSGPKAKVVVK